MTKAERLELQKQMLEDMSIRENELRQEGKKYIAGLDEVGRGPLAGPVYAACVVMPEDWDVLGVNDSKKVSPKKRIELDEIIREKATAYGIGIADSREIDELNILNATKLAMTRAIQACNDKLKSSGGEIDQLLLDAVNLDVDIPQEAMVKGDEKCLCIAAASIVAKVARDTYMIEMNETYPGYDFAGNKGYGTAAHYDGLREQGYTPIHRRSFLKKFEESMNMAKKVYAVRKGRTVGIFMDWDSCKQQVDGYPGAEYKSFPNVQQAAAYLDGVSEPAEAKATASVVRAYVDGSYDNTTKRFSCGVVIVETDENGQVKTTELNQCYDDAEAALQRNVAGEIMGSRVAIDYCISNGIKSVEIYHDYEGVGKWADNLWKANNPLTQGYKSYVAEARKTIEIRFVKVKAHAGNLYNERADKLAKEALGI